jgi:hypothetical protein
MARACSIKRWHKCRTDPSPPPRPPSSSGLHTRRTLSSFASRCKVCNFGAGFRARERGRWGGSRVQGVIPADRQTGFNTCRPEKRV